MQSKNQDTSALFSLQEIMRLEAERELGERVKEDQRLQEEQRARENAEQLARKREEERVLAEEARRTEEARRRREEEVRLEAIREAERERARTEAEHAGRLEALRAQQQHEQALAMLGRDKSKQRAKWIAILSVSLLVIVGVVGGALLRAQMQRTRELEGNIAGLQAEIEKKQTEMAQATTPEKRKELEDQLAALNGQVDALKAGRTAPPPQQHVAPPPVQNRVVPKKDDVCEEIRKNPNDPRRNDPMNGCL
jgi:hypothetical protein